MKGHTYTGDLKHLSWYSITNYALCCPLSKNLNLEKVSQHVFASRTELGSIFISYDYFKVSPNGSVSPRMRQCNTKKHVAVNSFTRSPRK